MARGFSVFVDIGGRLNGSLGSAVKSAEGQIGRLGRRVAVANRQVSAAFAGLDRGAAKIRDVGRQATAALALPAGFGVAASYSRVLGFEKELNKARALGELTDAETARIRESARSTARDFGFAAQSVAELSRVYVQAGRTVDQAIGMTRPTLNFALFGDIDAKSAADVVTSVASAYRMPMQSLEQAQSAATKIGDVLAKAANISRADVRDLAEGFKYAAPFAHRLGVSQEQLAASIAAMNQNGLGGAEAGVAMRSMLTRLVKPTLDARQAMAELGSSFAAFQSEVKPIALDDFANGLKNAGIDIGKIKSRLKAAIAKNDASSTPRDAGELLTSEIISGLAVQGVQDKTKIAKAVNKYVSSLGDAVDIDKLLKFLDEKGATAGQLARIFDQKQGGRLATLIGGEYEKFLAELVPSAQGSAARGAAEMRRGLPGADARFRSSLDDFVQTLGESGVTDTATRAVNGFADGIRSLSQASPKVLEIGTYAAVATAAIGPFALGLGALSLVLKPLVRLPLVGIAAGLGAIVSTLKGAQGLAKIGAASAAAGGAIASAAANDNGRGAVAGQAAKAGVAARGARFLGRAGSMVGNALIAKEIIDGVVDIGRKVAAGALRDPAAFSEAREGQLRADELRSRISQLESEIDAIRSRSKSPEMSDTLAQPKELEAAGLRNDLAAVEVQLEAVGKAAGDKLGAGVTEGAAKGALEAAGSTRISFLSADFSGAGSGAGLAVVNAFRMATQSLGKFGVSGIELAGARARGGPVRAGKTYLVGEKGPELFNARSSGGIVANDKLESWMSSDRIAQAMGKSGGVTINNGETSITVNVTSGDRNDVEFSRRVGREIDRYIRNLQRQQMGLLSD